jgi:hypothetical protein
VVAAAAAVSSVSQRWQWHWQILFQQLHDVGKKVSIVYLQCVFKLKISRANAINEGIMLSEFVWRDYMRGITFQSRMELLILLFLILFRIQDKNGWFVL